MSVTQKFRKDCRLCHSVNVEKVLSLVPTPPANELLDNPAEAKKQDKFPLDLYFCNDCFHMQLLNIVSPERLFTNYVYVSGTAPSFREHFREYASKIIEDYAIKPDSLVVDIGSNDGTLLSAFKERGMRVQGIDPAREIAANANAKGIDTIADFFSPDTAEIIKTTKGSAKVVVANNVFAHIDDLDAIITGIDILLDKRGIFVFEVSYLKDVIDKTLFDTIYHEHLDYHSIGPLRSFLNVHDFDIIDVVAIASHGGSIRVVAQKKMGIYGQKPSVEQFIASEKFAGLYEMETFRRFQQKIDSLGVELQRVIASVKNDGKSIVGYGLPAKATTLMYQFDIGDNVIEYVVDDSPLKQNLYSPGYGIKIVSSSQLKADTPDCIIILAWNFAQPIIEKLDWFLQDGGMIIVPLPEITIVTKDD